MLLPNFLMTVGYTSVANQFALDNFGIIGNGIYSAVNQTAAIKTTKMLLQHVLNMLVQSMELTWQSVLKLLVHSVKKTNTV